MNDPRGREGIFLGSAAYIDTGGIGVGKFPPPTLENRRWGSEGEKEKRGEEREKEKRRKRKKRVSSFLDTWIPGYLNACQVLGTIVRWY